MGRSAKFVVTGDMTHHFTKSSKVGFKSFRFIKRCTRNRYGLFRPKRCYPT